MDYRIYGILQASIVAAAAAAKSLQSCPTRVQPYRQQPTRLPYPWDSPGKNTGVEWVAIPFSRGSSQPRDRTQVSCIAGGFFSRWTIRKDHVCVCVCTHMCIYMHTHRCICMCIYVCICVCVCVCVYTCNVGNPGLIPGLGRSRKYIHTCNAGDPGLIPGLGTSRKGMFPFTTNALIYNINQDLMFSKIWCFRKKMMG